jgi:L-threonylcarbamoyladenylate synthase
LILDAGPTPIGVESTVLDLTQSPPAILRAGGVSREELERVLGQVQLGRAVSDHVARQGLASPGLSFKHYAPRAAVELFDHAAQLRERADALRDEGKQVGLLTITDDIDRLAHTLFAQLRELDAQNVDVILCVLPPPQGLGLAVRDRLLRAAGQGGPP